MPRKRYIQDPPRRANGLKAVSSPSGGFIDVTGINRVARNLRSLTDFSELSDSLTKFISASQQAEEEADRFSTKGGDLAGKAQEDLLKKDNPNKKLSDWFKGQPDDVRESFMGLSPRGQRQFADGISISATTNLENKFRAAILSAEEAPTIGENGEPLVHQSVESRFQAVFDEESKRSDELYGDHPMVRNAVRNRAVIALESAKGDGLKVEGQLRTRHMLSSMTSINANALLNVYDIEQDPVKVEAGQKLVIENLTTSEMSKSARLTLGEKFKPFLVQTGTDMAMRAASKGHYDQAKDFIIDLWHAGEGNSLSVSHMEEQVKAINMIDALEKQDLARRRGVSKSFQTDEQNAAFLSEVRNISLDNPGIGVLAVVDKIVKSGFKTQQEIDFFMGSDGGAGHARISNAIKAAQNDKTMPGFLKAHTAINAANSVEDLSRVRGDLDALNLSPDQREQLDATISQRQKNAVAFSDKVTTIIPVTDSTKRSRANGDMPGVFFSIFPEYKSWLQPGLAQLGGQKITSIFTDAEREMSTILKNPNTDPAMKEVEINKLNERVNTRWSALAAEVKTQKDAAWAAQFNPAVEVFNKLRGLSTADFPQGATDRLKPYLTALKGIDPLQADQAVKALFDQDPRFLISQSLDKVFLPVVEDMKDELFRTAGKVGANLQNSTLPELFQSLKESGAGKKFSRLEEIPFNDPDAMKLYFMSPKFMAMVHTQGGGNLPPQDLASIARTYLLTEIHPDDIKEKASPSSRPSDETVVGTIQKEVNETPSKVFNDSLKQASTTITNIDFADREVEWDLVTRTDSLSDRFFPGVSSTQPRRGPHDNPFAGAKLFYPYEDLSPEQAEGFQNAVLGTLTGSGHPDNKPTKPAEPGSLRKNLEDIGDAVVLGFTGGLVDPRKSKKETPKVSLKSWATGPIQTLTQMKSDMYVGDSIEQTIRFRTLVGKYGTSMAPIHAAFEELAPLTTEASAVNRYLITGVPTDAHLVGMSSNSRKALSKSLMGSDWNGFLSMMEVSKPLIDDDPRFDIIEDLTGFSIYDDTLVGKKLSDVAVFDWYARFQHSLHRRWNGASTPKEFSFATASDAGKPKKD